MTEYCSRGAVSPLASATTRQLLPPGDLLVIQMQHIRIQYDRIMPRPPVPAPTAAAPSRRRRSSSGNHRKLDRSPIIPPPQRSLPFLNPSPIFTPHHPSPRPRVVERVHKPNHISQRSTQTNQLRRNIHQRPLRLGVVHLRPADLVRQVGRPERAVGIDVKVSAGDLDAAPGVERQAAVADNAAPP